MIKFKGFDPFLKLHKSDKIDNKYRYRMRQISISFTQSKKDLNINSNQINSRTALYLFLISYL